MKQTCDKCEREGKQHIQHIRITEHGFPKTETQNVVRCYYHNRNYKNITYTVGHEVEETHMKIKIVKTVGNWD